MKYTCEQCGKHYGRRDNLQRHKLSHHDVPSRFICHHCEEQKPFRRRDSLNRHLLRVHGLRPGNAPQPNIEIIPQSQQPSMMLVETSPLTPGPSSGITPPPGSSADSAQLQSAMVPIPMKGEHYKACQMCVGEPVFISREELTVHLQEQHGWDMAMVTAYLNEAFVTLVDLLAAKDMLNPTPTLTPSGVSRMEHDDEEFWSMQEARDPAPLGGYNCSFCTGKFDRLRDLWHHLFFSHGMSFPFVGKTAGRPRPSSVGGQGGGATPPLPQPSPSSAGGATPKRRAPRQRPSTRGTSRPVQQAEGEILGDLSTVMLVECETSHRGGLKTYGLRKQPPYSVTIQEFLVTVFDDVVTLLRSVLERVTAAKVNLWMFCEFINVHRETCERNLKTKMVAVLRTTNLEEFCSIAFQKLVDEKEACEMKGSGWAFFRLLQMEVRINVYQPLKGNAFIRLPNNIMNKKAVINVKNVADNRCFEYAILTRYVNNPSRHQLYSNAFTDEVRARANLDFTELNFPVRVDQIRTFERKNGVSINLYALDSGKHNNVYRSIVYPLRIAETVQPTHFDLLYLTGEGGETHYAYITNFERLVKSQLTCRGDKFYICRRCFASFDKRPNTMGVDGKQRLEEHMKYCQDHAPVRTDISGEKEICFRHPERSQRARFQIYADFECALVPFDVEQPLNSSPTVPPPAWDTATNRGKLHNHRNHGRATLDSAHVQTKCVHEPYAYAYYVLDDLRNIDDGDNDETNDDGSGTFCTLRVYRGEDAAKHFMEAIRKDVRRIGDILYADRQQNPQLSAQQEVEFLAATVCYICDRPFTADDYKVRDHRHTTPFDYRGAAHRSCNFQHKEQDTVNCYFHNLSNYDAHFVVRELDVDGGDVNVIANTEEKFITISKRFEYANAGRHGSIQLRFLDSYRFLSRDLAGLASILPIEQMKVTRAHFPIATEFDLVCRKGVFPYEYVSSLKVLDEETLPPPQAFRDNLRKEEVSPEDYEHAQRVWTEFNCGTLGDYADVYLRTDVLLLADIFETFRDKCLHHYGLDPAHYITLPSYSWDVMLRKTGVTLDTLQDVDQYLFFEKGIRGGLAQCVTRHCTAHNKYTRGDDVEQDDDEYIMYYDANNLYGWAMSEPLPYGGFEWLSRKEIDSLHLEVRNIPSDGAYGYVLEVDLEYPRDLHDRHRDLPFCPEAGKPPADRLPYSEDVRCDFNIGRSTKLMATLMDKKEYVIHIRSLQQAMDNGLLLRHIHRILRFRQSAWLKPYVELNTRLRQQTTVKFEIELFKLMNNAVYGKSLQNVRKHINLKLTTNADTYMKYVAKSNFSDRTWFNENLALIHMAKVRIVLDKPVYVGMSILDLSKWWMYRFHYRMIDRYGLDKNGLDKNGLDHIRLLYMDTDSLTYRIRTGDVYRDMLEHIDDFDTSNYPQGHICYDEQNARVLGKFKDEANGRLLVEFIGLMAKLYCFVFYGERGEGPPPIKKAKGVNRAVVRGLTVDDYRRCLQDHRIKNTRNERFASRHHKIYTVSVWKRSLAPYDDKRYVLSDGVTTLPWGHYAIPMQSAPTPPDHPDDTDEYICGV